MREPPNGWQALPGAVQLLTQTRRGLCAPLGLGPALIRKALLVRRDPRNTAHKWGFLISKRSRSVKILFVDLAKG